MAQNSNLLFSTDDWVEIYRTTDEWESNLIQTMLGNEQIRYRPDYIRNADRQRQIILSVHPDDRVESLEIVSRTGLAITNEEYENQHGDDEIESRLKRADEASGSDSPQPTPTEGTATIVGEREEIGRIAHYVGRGYELQVGPTPYYMVEEGRWEEFIDFSAQRQEFSILIRHEYPDLALWLRQENLLPEFIRLVESTYRDVPPSRAENRQQTTPTPNNGGATEVQINRLAKFGLWVSLVSLLGVIVQLPWYASLILALLAAVVGCVAKFQIDRSHGTLKGNLLAFLAIIIACIVIVIAWGPTSVKRTRILGFAVRLPAPSIRHPLQHTTGEQDMDACVIVFVKNPVPGQVKTRLVPYLSPEQAASLYQAFLVDWCNALSTISTARRVIAYTPPESLGALQTLIGKDPVYISQQGASLGERLIAAARWACDQGYARFLFVGSDSPTLPIPYVEHALDLLESRDVVIGPSVDGGYYLIGFSMGGASLSIPAIFEEVSWSTEVVFRQTLGKVQATNAQLGLLPPWYDVDTSTGLQLLQDHLFGMDLAGESSLAYQTYSKLTEWF